MNRGAARGICVVCFFYGFMLLGVIMLLVISLEGCLFAVSWRWRCCGVSFRVECALRDVGGGCYLVWALCEVAVVVCFWREFVFTL